MITSSIPSARVLLYGLSDSLALALRGALQMGSSQYQAEAMPQPADLLHLLRTTKIDLVLCSSRRGQSLPLLRWLRQENLAVPVVVVSEEPEFDEWHAAMEAGAVDYCSAPLDASQLRWILHSYVASQRLAA